MKGGDRTDTGKNPLVLILNRGWGGTLTKDTLRGIDLNFSVTVGVDDCLLFVMSIIIAY